MGRTLYVAENVQLSLSALMGKPSIGLLIAHMTPNKDHLIHLVRCPAKVVEGTDGLNTQKVSDLAKIDEKWICKHAKRVQSMLTGGLSVCGMFAVAPNDQHLQLQVQLKNLVCAIEKHISRTLATRLIKDVYGVSNIGERYVVLIDLNSKRVLCKTTNPADISAPLSSAEWKPPKHLSWMKLQAVLNIEVLVAISNDLRDQEFSKQLQSALSKQVSQLQSAEILFNEEVRDNSNSLIAETKGTKRNEQSLEIIEVEFMSQDLASNTGKPRLQENCALLRLAGNITCLAYVTNKASVAEAKQAILNDAVQSIVQRSDLVARDFLALDEEEQEGEFGSETPARVLLKLVSQPLCLCDYVFPDEEPSDVLNRSVEYLDLPITENELEFIERQPTRDEMVSLSLKLNDESEDVVGDEYRKSDSVANHMSRYFTYGIAGLGALCSLAFYYLTAD